MPRLVAERAELARLVRLTGVDSEDLVAYAKGEDELVGAAALERIERARTTIYDVAMSPLWGSVVPGDDE